MQYWLATYVHRRVPPSLKPYRLVLVVTAACSFEQFLHLAVALQCVQCGAMNMDGTFQATARFEDLDIFQKATKMALRCTLSMNSNLSGFKL